MGESMSFFNGLIVAREQAFGAKAVVTAPSVPSLEGVYGTPAKMALPKRKWLLIKQFLEEETRE